MITNRPRRLAGVAYVGIQRYFLTTCTAHRHDAFRVPDVAERAISQLRQTATTHAFEISAYCFMPDHAHLLVQGTTLDADMERFIIDFKKRTGFDYSKRARRRLWQAGYYDRILRDDESNDAVARYILENPVRAGLAEKIGEYPYAGSELYDLAALLSAWDSAGQRWQYRRD